MHALTHDTCTLLTRRTSPEVLTTTLHVSRNEKERVMIEGSVNSVRISVKIKQVCAQDGVWVVGVDSVRGWVWGVCG